MFLHTKKLMYKLKSKISIKKILKYINLKSSLDVLFQKFKLIL